MRSEYDDRIKSFLLGIVVPVFFALLGVPYMTGEPSRDRRGKPLDPAQGFGYGLSFVGVSLLFHALFLQSYDNHQALKYFVISCGVSAFLVGLYLQFR